ncbi:ABC transporter ATP-binding protein [Streptomyces durbertensis]|uniref:ABC transporter ATP-binding protein n=1 Tax=Streptomyces durbertensis TaxID=2448886 RepID=A0ABR6EAK6_9ACTN|nr:ABC transporter ATP-binding protein [Streptomyces durbertensis]
MPVLLRRRPWSVAAVAVCGVGAALAALALPAVLGVTVDRLLAGGPVPWRWLALCALLTAAEVALDAAVVWCGGVNSAVLTSWLRRRAVDRLLSAEPHRAQAFSRGDLTTRLTTTTGDAAGAPVAAAGVASAVLLPVGGLVGIVLTDHWTALALLAGVPALVLLLRVFTRDTAAATRDYQRVQASVATRLAEAVAGAATVRAAGTARREHRRITEPLTELGAHGRRTWRVYGRAVGLSSVLLPLLTALVLAVGGLRLAAGAVTVGELVTIGRYAALVVGIGAVTGALGGLARGRAAGERLRPLFALPVPTHRDAALPPDGPGTLVLRDVGVVRDGRRLLRDVNLTVPGGTCLAVVGRSGSGKSTLAAVAGRLADPDEGTVALDGVPLPDVAPHVLRREVGYAFARPALPGDTVGDAIAFGVDRPPPEAVRAAAGDAAADGFVRLLPHGYRTPVADAPMSGGERQRLGLARAFVRSHRLLVLDDATSALDTATERRVWEALDRMAGHRTRLVVAHRLSTAARADCVAWLEDGGLRAVGRHEELWRDPAYREVFQTPPTAPPSTAASASPPDRADHTAAPPPPAGEPEGPPPAKDREGAR